MHFNIRSIVLLLFLPFILNESARAATSDTAAKSFRVAFWNLENLFDIKNDAGNDDDFTPEGAMVWTRNRYNRKLQNLSRVMDSIHADLFGVCEVENKQVMLDLSGVLRKSGLHYEVIHFESPDERGIDAGLFYNKSVFRVISAAPVEVQLPENDKTRDILYVMLLHLATGDSLHVFVNHWPSRRGGESGSDVKRAAAAETLKKYMIARNLYQRKSLIMGDFNDGPDDSSINQVLKACYPSKEITGCELMNLSLLARKGENGTIKHGREWHTFDQLITTRNLYMDAEGNVRYKLFSVKVYLPEWLRETEGRFAGNPQRTYAGKLYLGGYSDHFPVMADFVYE